MDIQVYAVRSGYQHLSQDKEYRTKKIFISWIIIMSTEGCWIEFDFFFSIFF